MSVVSEWVEIKTPDGPMAAYRVKPAQENVGWPAILVFMEIFGINSHIRQVCERLASEGYVTLAINYYHRTTPNLLLGYSKEDMEIGRLHKNKTTPNGLFVDVQSALDYLATLAFVKPGSVGTIGFCYGGNVAYRVAVFPAIKASACFYPGGAGDVTDPNAPIHTTSDISGQMLCFFGEKDPLIPKQHADEIEMMLSQHHIPYEIVRYPDVGHGFFCDERADYNPDAANDAWQRIKHLFATQLT